MKIKILVYSLIIISSFSCQNPKTLPINYEHPIVYEPKTYVCYQTNEELVIDGKLEEKIWKNTPNTADFVDIQGDIKPIPAHETNVRMLWDSTYFYFGAYLQEPHIWGKLRERDAVIFYDNDFEIFIDPDGDTHNYYEFEINALNTVWDLLLLKPYREDGAPKVLDSWDIQGLKSAIHVNGTLNNSTDIDSFWTVEIAIPWAVLLEMTPKKFFPKEGVQWRINFSRVNWKMDTSNGDYQKQKDANGKNLPEENWVWSPQGYINMHAPETWGFVQFSEKIAGQEKIRFISSKEDEIKWALRQLYYQQRKYFKAHHTYTDDLKKLTLPIVEITNYSFEPQLFRTYNGYEIIAKSIDNQWVWLISADGKISKTTSNKDQN